MNLIDGDKSKKVEWEHTINHILIEWQTSLANLKTNRTRETLLLSRRLEDEFYHQLYYTVPKQYKYLVLEIYFTPKDVQEMTGLETTKCGTIEDMWGANPVNSDLEGKTYELPICAPKETDWSKSNFTEYDRQHRGSPVRDYQAQHPDLKTIWRPFIAGRDDETMQCIEIELRSYASSMPIFESDVRLFPRNIRRITLSTQPPNYLDDNEIKIVENRGRSARKKQLQ